MEYALHKDYWQNGSKSFLGVLYLVRLAIVTLEIFGHMDLRLIRQNYIQFCDMQHRRSGTDTNS